MQKVRFYPNKIIEACGDPTAFNQGSTNTYNQLHKWFACAGRIILDKQKEVEFSQLTAKRQSRKIKMEKFVGGQSQKIEDELSDLRVGIAFVKDNLPSFREAGTVSFERRFGPIVFDSKELSFEEANAQGFLKPKTLEYLKQKIRLRHLHRPLLIDVEEEPKMKPPGKKSPYIYDKIKGEWILVEI